MTKIKAPSGSKERSDNMSKITELKCRSIGKSGNVLEHAVQVEAKGGQAALQITQLECRKAEVWLPKMEQIRMGSTEISGNVSKTTQLLNGSAEVRQLVYNHTALMLKPREVGNMPRMTHLRSGSTER